MASWKKVIVSGSSAELAQLTVDTSITASGISSSGDIIANDLTLSGDLSLVNLSATQITGSIISASVNLIAGTTTLGATTVSTLKNDSTIDATQLTGSFTGSFKGTFTNSDGTALEAEWDGTRDGNSQITGSGAGPSLVLSGSTGNDLLVSKNAQIDGSLTAGATTVTTLINDSAVASSHLTGSFSGSFTGDGNSLDLSTNSTLPATDWDGTLSVENTVGIDSAQITGSGAAASLILSGSTGNDLDVKKNAVIGGNLTVTQITGSIISGSTLIAGATTLDTLNVNGNVTLGTDKDDTVTIEGNLNVNGTASFTNATNLSVADKYILLNSGSSTAGDGGIVIQQADGGIGELFGFDSSANRFGITGSFDADSAANFIPDAFMSMVVSGSAGEDTPDNAPARYQQAGNIFAGANGDIYIYGN